MTYMYKFALERIKTLSTLPPLDQYMPHPPFAKIQ